MKEHLNKTIEVLSNHIQKVIEGGSSEEMQLLPELVNSLSKLVEVFNDYF